VPHFWPQLPEVGTLNARRRSGWGGRLVALEVPRETLPVVFLRRTLIEQRVAFRAASSVMVDTDADWLGRSCRLRVS